MAIATHGMVMTVWLLARGLIGPDEAGGFWADLRFPDCLALPGDGPPRRYP